MNFDFTEEQVMLRDSVERYMREDYDFVVIATGAQKPRMLPIPGNERALSALEFLEKLFPNGLADPALDNRAEHVELGALFLVTLAG